MRLNKKVLLSIVVLPFCAALFGCSVATIEQSEWVVVQPATRPAPVVKAPVYKDGDWWKVKIELKSGSTWSCRVHYSDYLLEIQEGKPKLYVTDGTNKDEFDCHVVEDDILGKITRKLKFPLQAGNRWTHRYPWNAQVKYRNPYNKGLVWVEYEVLGWERVQTPKGVFEAFKLSSVARWRSDGHDHEVIGTYYYSPKVKAIILHRHIRMHPPSISIDRDTIITVVDFNVSN